MNETNKLPTVAELTRAGNYVEVTHLRNWKTSYVDPLTNKVVVKVIQQSRTVMEDGKNEDSGVLYQLMATGGRTEMTVTDCHGQEFYVFSRCRDDENYNKKLGVETCLYRLRDLVRVSSYHHKKEIQELADIMD